MEDILRALQKLEVKIDAALARVVDDPYESKETKDLNLALARAAAEYPKIKSNRKNNYYKNYYSDLDNIMFHVRPILSRHGLSLTQRTFIMPDGSTVLKTRLWHSSGQWIESRTRLILPRDDLKTYISIFNMMKKQQVISILNVTLEDDVEDDDLVNATGFTQKKDNPISIKTITKDQLEELELEIGNDEKLATMILETYNLQTLSDLPKDKFLYVINKIRKIKALK